MRHLHAAALLALLLASPLFAIDHALVGRWRNAVTSSSGLGTVLEFRDDGSVDLTAAAVVEAQFRLEGDRLILPPATSSGPPQVEQLQWVDDNTIHLSQPGETLTLTRPPSPANASRTLLGEWTTTRKFESTPVTAHYTFLPGQRLLLIIPLRTEKGTCTTAGGHIHITANGTSIDGQYTVSGDSLTLPNSSHKLTGMKRF